MSRFNRFEGFDHQRSFWQDPLKAGRWKFTRCATVKGMEASIMTYGGVVVSLTAPDRDGKFADVVLGFDRLEDYLKFSPYFGAIVGRYANRIGGAQFTLEGKTYTLAQNSGPHSLHGGIKGFDKVIWSAKAVESANGPGARTHLFEPGRGGRVTPAIWR